MDLASLQVRIPVTLAAGRLRTINSKVATPYTASLVKKGQKLHKIDLMQLTYTTERFTYWSTVLLGSFSCSDCPSDCVVDGCREGGESAEAMMSGSFS